MTYEEKRKEAREIMVKLGGLSTKYFSKQKEGIDLIYNWDVSLEERRRGYKLLNESKDLWDQLRDLWYRHDELEEEMKQEAQK